MTFWACVDADLAPTDINIYLKEHCARENKLTELPDIQ